MGKVGVAFSMSLDGFIADENDGVEQLFAWYETGDTELSYLDGQMTFKVSAISAPILQEFKRTTGAIVAGRRLFDITQGWGGRHPLEAPIFVVTHTVPQEWVGRDAPWTFVTDGVASAVAQAQAVAGDKDVGVAGASIARQCLAAGLLDEIHIDLVPVLLGRGIRLFDSWDTPPIRLERTLLVKAPGVTHLRFRVVREHLLAPTRAEQEQ